MIATHTGTPQCHEAQLLNVIVHHFGDGTVYLPQGTPYELLFECLREGLVSDDGFITKKGRELIAQYID